MLTILLRRYTRDDGGWAMLTVIASILIMTIFATAGLELASGRQKNAKRDQNFTAAGEAAEAGIDDYLARLQNDGNYFTEGNSDPTNEAMTGWEQVPGTTTSAEFKYSVDTSNAYTTGYIKITSTGSVNGVDRTVTAELAKTSFLDYMYFTKYETQSPVTYPASAGSTSTITTDCSQFEYNGRPDPVTTGSNQTQYCAPIYFATGDTLKGPVHSEDEIQFSGSPTFQSEFSTEWQDPAGKYYHCESGATCNPTFSASYPPQYKIVQFPSTNTQLEQYADPTVGGKGCLFQGPTSIVLNPDGTMSVVSPETPSSFNTGACGTANWASSQTISVPTGEVIYDEAPTATCSTFPTGFPNFPASTDKNTTSQPTGLQTGLATDCSHGDVFIQGWLKGQLTVAASNNIYVTDSLRYVGTNSSPSATNLDSGIPTSSTGSPPSADTAGSDVLGLSASNFVEVMHPLTNCQSANRQSSGVCPTTSANTSLTASPGDRTNIEVDAAIVASQGSFIVEDWGSGPDLGTLTVDGGIIQEFRGPVGCSGCWGSGDQTGYLKDYNYDNRLLTLTPPHLADLASSAWNLDTYGEGAPQ